MAEHSASNVLTASMASSRYAKATSGKQKIVIKKIQNKDALQVCFSKRRAGLFKKASELATLYDAELVIVVFSPGGRPYILGLPDLQTVVNRFFLCHESRAPAIAHPSHYRAAFARERTKKLTSLRSALEKVRRRRQPIGESVRATARAAGFNCGLELKDVELEELCRLEQSLQALRSRLAGRAKELSEMMAEGETEPIGVAFRFMNLGWFQRL